MTAGDGAQLWVSFGEVISNDMGPRTMNVEISRRHRPTH